MQHETTIFQKISNREIPAHIVYEDDTHIAFLDINPIRKGHTLFVPKTPYQWITDMPTHAFSALMERVHTFAPILKQETGADFIMLIIEGQDVPHVHVHLVPRRLGDAIGTFDRESYQAGEREALVDALTRGEI
jgi:histidine triad (HIT) family protein